MPSTLQNLRLQLAPRQLDGVLITQPTNRRYLSGFTGSAGSLFITRDEAVLATDFRYIEQAKSQAPAFRIVQITGELKDWFPKIVSDVGCKTVGFESDSLSHAEHGQLVQSLRRLPPRYRPRMVPSTGMVESLRVTKRGHEIATIERAAGLADAAIDRAREVLKPGVTEIQLAWELEKFMRNAGSESMPFPIIVASGPNAARPHAEPSDRPIESGEPVIIDLGARLDGYCSDITRTLWTGKPDRKLAQVYGIVRKAQSAALSRIAPGMSGAEADHVARQIIDNAGFAGTFGHGLGHGVGLDVHEQPRLGSNSNDVLATGMVVTVEPGIYIEGWGGVRIEDMVLLDENGPRVLTKARTLEV